MSARLVAMGDIYRDQNSKTFVLRARVAPTLTRRIPARAPLASVSQDRRRAVPPPQRRAIPRSCAAAC